MVAVVDGACGCCLLGGPGQVYLRSCPCKAPPQGGMWQQWNSRCRQSSVFFLGEALAGASPTAKIAKCWAVKCVLRIMRGGRLSRIARLKLSGIYQMYTRHDILVVIKSHIAVALHAA